MALDDDGRLTLRSYLWPDQLDRLRALDGALEVAAGIPVSVERSGAADWLERRLAEPVAGRVHGGLPLDRHAVRGRRGARPDRRADRRGGRARDRAAPRSRGSALEPGGELAELRLTVWPGGEERVLAHAGYHGEPVRWEDG